MATRTGPATNFLTPTPTDFGAPFTPTAITGIAVGAAAGLGLVAIGIAFLLALVIKPKATAKSSFKSDSTTQLEAPKIVSAYEPMAVRGALGQGNTPRGSTNGREGGTAAGGGGGL